MAAKLALSGAVAARIDADLAATDELLRGRVTGIRTARYLYTEWQPEPGEKRPGVLVELSGENAQPEHDDASYEPREH